MKFKEYEKLKVEHARLKLQLVEQETTLEEMGTKLGQYVNNYYVVAEIPLYIVGFYLYSQKFSTCNGRSERSQQANTRF